MHNNWFYAKIIEENIQKNKHKVAIYTRDGNYCYNDVAEYSTRYSDFFKMKCKIKKRVLIIS